MQRGDEIVSVDGKPVDETNIVAAVRGTDIVGSHVKLRVRKRDGRMVEANLVRGAWGAVERKERLSVLLPRPYLLYLSLLFLFLFIFLFLSHLSRNRQPMP